MNDVAKFSLLALNHSPVRVAYANGKTYEGHAENFKVAKNGEQFLVVALVGGGFRSLNVEKIQHI